MHNPYIFFECQYDNLGQLESYKEVFSELVAMGYSSFTIFDNYGQFVVSTGELEVIFDLLDYVKRQNFSSSTRTIFYYDILAYSSDMVSEVEVLMLDYNRH